MPQVGPILVNRAFHLTGSWIGLEQNNLFPIWWLC